MWNTRGGAARAHRGRGFGRAPSEKLQGECVDPVASKGLDELNALLGKESNSALLLHPSLMPLHIVADPGAAVPCPSILGCYSPELHTASTDGALSDASCYIHVKDPNIRALCNGQEWTVVSGGDAVARWVLDPAHLKHGPTPPETVQLHQSEPESSSTLKYYDPESVDLPHASASSSSRLEPLSTPQQQHPGSNFGLPQQRISQVFSTKSKLNNREFMLSPLASGIHMKATNPDILVRGQQEHGQDSHFAPATGIRVCFAPLYLQIQTQAEGNAAADKTTPDMGRADGGAPVFGFAPDPFAVPLFPASSAGQTNQVDGTQAYEQLHGYTGIFAASTECCNGLPVYYSNPRIEGPNSKIFILRLSTGETFSVKLVGNKKQEKKQKLKKSAGFQLVPSTLESDISPAELNVGVSEVDGSEMLNVGSSGEYLWLLEETTSDTQVALLCKKPIACCLAATSSLGSCANFFLSNNLAWMQTTESSAVPPQLVIQVSSQLPRIVSVSGSKGHRSFALNGNFLIHHVSFQFGSIRFRKMDSHFVFLDYSVEKQQWIAHFQFQPSAYCGQLSTSGNSARNTPVLSQAVTYYCQSLPFAEFGHKKVYGLCGKCALKLLRADCPFLPAVIAQSSPPAKKKDVDTKLCVILPDAWIASASVGNIDLDFSDGGRFTGHDWDPFGMGRGRRGRGGGRGRVWRGGRGGGGRGGRGGLGINLGFGLRAANLAPGETAIRIPLPNDPSPAGAALDFSDVAMTFLPELPYHESQLSDPLSMSLPKFSFSNVSTIASTSSTNVASSKRDFPGLSVCILPSLLSSARWFETLSKNQLLLSEFFSQTVSSCGSIESAIMDFVSVCSLANANCCDLLCNSVIGEHVFSSTISAVKRWAEFIDFTSNQDTILSSCVPVSSAVKQIVQRMFTQSSFVQFPFRGCKVKYRVDSEFEPDREGTVLLWTALDELEVEMHPIRGNFERISESCVISTIPPNCSQMLPRACGLLLQTFVYDMQRNIHPITEQIIDRCSGISNFLSVASDYILRLSTASIAVLLARNTFAIGADTVAESVHPCAIISSYSECDLCYFESASEDLQQNLSNGLPGSRDLREEISSTRVFFHDSVPRIAYSSTMCGTRCAASSLKLAESCCEVMRWSLVNVNQGDSAWAVILIPAAQKPVEASEILSRTGVLGLNFGLPNCSLSSLPLEYGQVVTVSVDASQCQVTFIVNNRLVSALAVPPADFPLYLAVSGCSSAYIRILHEPFLSIPRESLNYMMDDLPVASHSHCFVLPENVHRDIGMALAKYLCWLRKAASSSSNFELDFSIQIPMLSLFFIIRDIASLSPDSSEYFRGLHIGTENLRGIVSPAVVHLYNHSEKSAHRINDAVQEELMKMLTTSNIRIQDLLSLIHLSKQGTLKQFLFSKVFDDCILPAIHRCIRLLLFEEIQKPSSLQILSEILPETRSTLQGMFHAMFVGPEQEVLSKQLHLPPHTIVADAIIHHVECSSKKRMWTIKFVDDNIPVESRCICEATDLNSVLIFRIDIESSALHDDFHFAAHHGNPEISLHLVVFHLQEVVRKTVKVRSVHNLEISVAVDSFGVIFSTGQRKQDFEVKACGLSALIDSVSFPPLHFCIGSEQPIQDISPHSLAPKWVLNLALRSIDQKARDKDIVELIRDLPQLVLDHFEAFGLIPISCSFFRNSVRFVISSIFRKRLISINQDPVAYKSFSHHMKDSVLRALSGLQSGIYDEVSRELWSEYFAAYSLLGHATDTTFLSSRSHSSNITSVVNEWTCLKRNESSLIVHVSRPYSAVISTAVYPKIDDERDPFNPHFHPHSQVHDSVIRMCYCTYPLPTGTSIINIKVCSSLLDLASFGVMFSTFKCDGTIGSSPDSWGILCSGAIQHKGERRGFLTIGHGSIITLVYSSHSGSLSVSLNNQVVHEFFGLPSHSIRFAATLGLSVTEATLFEVDFVQSYLCPPIHHEGITSACAALRVLCTTFISCLDMIAHIRHFSDALLVSDNSKRSPLSVVLFCAEIVASEYLSQIMVLPDLTPTQCITVAELLSAFGPKLETFIKNCFGNSAVDNQVLSTFMRSHVLTSTADVPLPSFMVDVLINIAVAQISLSSSDDSSNFRDKARTTVVDMILSFLDFSDELGIQFPHAGSAISLKSASDVAPADSVDSIDVVNSESFFPFSEELAQKIDAVTMAQSLYAFVEEQMQEMLVYVVPNFFVMVMLSVKKRFSREQVGNQMSRTLSIPEPELKRLMVAIESFLRTWAMNDFTITYGAGVDILGVRQLQRRQLHDQPFGAFGGGAFGGRPRERKVRRHDEGNSGLEENICQSHRVSLRSEWSSCTLSELEVGLVIFSCQNACFVQGPFSRRILHIDQVKVVETNKSPLCDNIKSARAFLLQSNMVSSLISAVTQRCLLLLPAPHKVHIGKQLQTSAEKCIVDLVLSCGPVAKESGIKLAADVLLFEYQIVEDALTAGLNLATKILLSDASFASRIPNSSAKIYVISRLLYTYDYLGMNECNGTQNVLADRFAGLQIIKKFLFKSFSKELRVDSKILVPLMKDHVFILYSASVTRGIRCANISFDRRTFVSQIFRTMLCGDPEITLNMASAAADFLSNSCVVGSFVSTKQAVFKLVDCLSTNAVSRSPVIHVPIQTWVLDAILPDMLVPSNMCIGSETRLCFPHCGWCDVQLGDYGMIRTSPACGFILECIVGTPLTVIDICQRTRLSLCVVQDALVHLQNESLIKCDTSNLYRVSPGIDLHKPCVDTRLKFIGHGQQNIRLLPLGKDFVSGVAAIALHFRSCKIVDEVGLFQSLAVQGHSTSTISYTLSEMIAAEAIYRVGGILIENLEHFADASQLHHENMQKLTFSDNSGIRSAANFTIITKMVLVTPPASVSVPPFPPTSSMLCGFSMDSQHMEDLAAESLFAVAEHAQVDVLDVANFLLMGNNGNFISAVMNSIRGPPVMYDEELSSRAAAACAERCPIGSCTPSSSYKPLLLPCGHGACAECWQLLLEHALQTSSTPVVRAGEDTSGTRSVNCIKCPADISNKCNYKMKLTDVQSCVPQLAASFRNSVKRWFNRTIISGSFPMAVCSCGSSVFGRSMDSEVECQCGRISTVGDIKLGGSAQHWRSHPYSSCNTEHEWRLLSTHGSPERISLMRTKKCPRCLIDTTKCGCDASNVVCNGLDRCPNEACNHLICQNCKLDWCWICRKPGCHGCDQSANSSDLKERFHEGSKVVSKLDSALVPLYVSRFVLDDSQGGAVKIISVHADAQPCSLPLTAGDVFSSINGINVHSISDLMNAACLEHAVNSFVLIRYRRRSEFHSCWYNCEALPTGFNADAIVFKRSLYIHSIIRPQAQPLPPMQRLQRLCDVFVSLQTKAALHKKDCQAGSINMAINAANSDDFVQYALQFQQELSSDEAALMLFLREASLEQHRSAN